MTLSGVAPAARDEVDRVRAVVGVAGGRGPQATVGVERERRRHSRDRSRRRWRRGRPDPGGRRRWRSGRVAGIDAAVGVAGARRASRSRRSPSAQPATTDDRRAGGQGCDRIVIGVESTLAARRERTARGRAGPRSPASRPGAELPELPEPPGSARAAHVRAVGASRSAVVGRAAGVARRCGRARRRRRRRAGRRDGGRRAADEEQRRERGGQDGPAQARGPGCCCATVGAGHRRGGREACGCHRRHGCRQAERVMPFHGFVSFVAGVGCRWSYHVVPWHLLGPVGSGVDIAGGRPAVPT